MSRPIIVAVSMNALTVPWDATNIVGLADASARVKLTTLNAILTLRRIIPSLQNRAPSLA